ncbi:hypothetical protein CP973_20555 [Streptomyces albofaciens JCM 4342]|uniref:hypothetical protein n=1 Tax=Streptomyces albofaciens TaxID=66866 RepID=UPI000AE7ABE6|nr:hypothetical protein [Streptomyces albofaciens]KAA6223989.1 hypothetical protein CP973_20555 [Streptomyces albofaciens JCM 4342]
MSKDESLVDAAALGKLAKSFESYGSDLESYLKEFQTKTGSEAIHDGFGVLTESEEVTSAYIELSTDLTETLHELRRHLDQVSQGVHLVQQNTTATDESLSHGFGQGRHA